MPILQTSLIDFNHKIQRFKSTLHIIHISNFAKFQIMGTEKITFKDKVLQTIIYFSQNFSTARVIIYSIYSLYRKF